ncbi:MAG: hypothetical protein ACJASM_002264 [Salibacteraceae bacterium]|jgi:hypothetical protein
MPIVLIFRIPKNWVNDPKTGSTVELRRNLNRLPCFVFNRAIPRSYGHLPVPFEAMLLFFGIRNIDALFMSIYQCKPSLLGSLYNLLVWSRIDSFLSLCVKCFSEFGFLTMNLPKIGRGR